MNLMSTSITVDTRLDQNNREICLCERNVYSLRRTNKDGSKFWMCLVAKCNSTITTNSDNIVIKVNGQKLANNELSQIVKHVNHRQLTDSQVTQLYGAEVFSDENNNNTKNFEDTMNTIENTFTSMMSLNEADLDDNNIGNILYILQQNELGTYQLEMRDALEMANETNYSIAMFFGDDTNYSMEALEKGGVKALVSSDKERFCLLKSASDELEKEKRLSFYLAQADLVIEYMGVENGTADQWLEKERTLSIENIYDVNGAKKFENAIISTDFFTALFGSDINIYINIHKGIEEADTATTIEQLIDGKKYRTKTYQTFLLIIWPKKFEFENLIQIDYQSAAKLLFTKLSPKRSNTNNSYFHKFDILIRQLTVDSSYYSELFDKFLDALLIIHEASLTKAFFMKAINCKIDNQLLVPKLTRLLASLNHSELLDILKDIPTTNFTNNFYLLSRLLKLNDKKTASLFYDQKILPIMEKKVEFPFLTSAPELYLKFLEISLKLGDPQKTKSLKKLQELVKLRFNQDSLKLLLDFLVSKNSTDCKNLLDIFALRINWLVEKTKKEPFHDFKLYDVSFPESKIVEEFLRGSGERLAYSGGFKSVGEARMFVEKHTNLAEELNLKLAVSGTGKQISVVIEKTPPLEFDKEKESFTLFKKELKQLERKVKEIKLCK